MSKIRVPPPLADTYTIPFGNIISAILAEEWIRTTTSHPVNVVECTRIGGAMATAGIGIPRVARWIS